MHDAFFIAPPSDGGDAAHFPENNIDALNTLIPKTLKDTIRNRSPRVVCGQLNLDAKLAKGNVRETMRMRRKIHRNFELAKERSTNLVNAILKDLRLIKSSPPHGTRP